MAAFYSSTHESVRQAEQSQPQSCSSMKKTALSNIISFVPKQRCPASSYWIKAAKPSGEAKSPCTIHPQTVG